MSGQTTERPSATATATPEPTSPGDRPVRVTRRRLDHLLTAFGVVAATDPLPERS